MHLACWGGHFKTVKLMLETGIVNTKIKNMNNETPLDLSKDDSVSALLINYNAQASKSTNNLAGASDED